MQAIPIGNAQVIHTGSGQGQGDAWIMDALNNMQERQKQAALEQQRRDELRRRQGATAASAYGSRLSGLSNDKLAEAQSTFAAAMPDAAGDLTPYTLPTPRPSGDQITEMRNQFVLKNLPQWMDTLKNNPQQMSPQIFDMIHKTLAGDPASAEALKGMTDLYVSANEQRLPADLVQLWRYGAKLDITPEEKAVEAGVQRGHNLTLQGKREEIAANAPVRASEVKRNTAQSWAESNLGDLRGQQETDLETGQQAKNLKGNPTLIATQNQINLLQKEHDANLITARQAKTPAERAAAQDRVTQTASQIGLLQTNLQNLTSRMRKTMGIADEPMPAPATNEAPGGGPQGGYLNLGRPDVPPQPGAGTGPQIHDMRGSNMPRTPAAAPAPAAGGAPDAAKVALAQQLAASGQIDRAKKTMTAGAAKALKAQGVDTAGYTIIGQ